MKPELTGKLKILALQGVAAALSMALKPDPGFRWEVLDAIGWSDEAGHYLQWHFTDGTNTLDHPGLTCSSDYKAGVFLTTSTYAPAGTAVANSLTGIPILGSAVWTTLTADAMGAGQHLHINALVLEYAEV